MPPAAITAGGMALSGASGFFGNRGARQTTVPPPGKMYPELNSDYIGDIGAVGKASTGSLTDIAKTGAPTSFAGDWKKQLEGRDSLSYTDYSQMFEALKAANKRQEGEGRANIIEAAGFSGTRTSSAVLDKLVDYEGQLGKDYGSILADYAYKALESWKNRNFSAEEGALGRTSTAEENAAQRKLTGSEFGTTMYSEPGLQTYQNTLFQPQSSGKGAGMGSLGSAITGIGGLATSKGAFSNLFKGGGGDNYSTIP